MFKLACVYLHLLATCGALSLIVLADVRVLRQVLAGSVRLPPPTVAQKRAVSACLMVLCLTGGTLVALGLQERADYLQNGKLIAKLMVVLTLLINALVLHLIVFPALADRRRVARWSAARLRVVSLSVGLSSSLWFFAAFLGVARAWNFVKPTHEILLIALALWLVVAAAVRLVLAVAAAQGAPDASTRPSNLLRLKQMCLQRWSAVARDAEARIAG